MPRAGQSFSVLDQFRVRRETTTSTFRTSMMDAGVTPLEVLIEQTHKRGMEFIAKFRMNDRHGNGDQGARFILDNPSWQLEEFPGGQDFSFEPVRDYVYSVADEVVERFDVDGLLFNYIRHGHCFPTDVARERHPVMTGFLQRIREMLDRRGAQQRKTLTLGVMIPQTLEECYNLGFDISTWIREGLINYICPCDFHYADFNAPYEEFSQLTRGSDCLLYPTLSPNDVSWGCDDAAHSLKATGHSHKISMARVPTAFRFSTTSTTGREREGPPATRDPSKAIRSH